MSQKQKRRPHHDLFRTRLLELGDRYQDEAWLERQLDRSERFLRQNQSKLLCSRIQSEDRYIAHKNSALENEEQLLMWRTYGLTNEVAQLEWSQRAARRECTEVEEEIAELGARLYQLDTRRGEILAELGHLESRLAQRRLQAEDEKEREGWPSNWTRSEVGQLERAVLEMREELDWRLPNVVRDLEWRLKALRARREELTYRELPELSQRLLARENERLQIEGRTREIQRDRRHLDVRKASLQASRRREAERLEKAQQEWWMREQERIEKGFRPA
ncbi:MAG: hypothetical protein KC910_06055 [Candidatus Eremiobacteraeota bacterium]|nr:hypothetical protein [Candidatus Eremiobacteraeota bacterium]